MHFKIDKDSLWDTVLQKLYEGPSIGQSDFPGENDQEITAYFVGENFDFSSIRNSDAPVFVDSMCNTLEELKAPANAIRVNLWPGFYEKNCWEICGAFSEKHNAVLQIMNVTVVSSPDVPGFISARVLSLIINEAYSAWSSDVSSKEEIDLAMCNGTNYPLGPFEWANKIGKKNVCRLLNALMVENIKYAPVEALEH